MNAVIEKMRADFVLVGEDRIQSGLWTLADYEEVGAIINGAIESKEATQIMMWSRWLADLAAWVVAYRMICVPTNRCIEAAVAESRAAKSMSQGQPPGNPSTSPRRPTR